LRSSSHRLDPVALHQGGKQILDLGSGDGDASLALIEVEFQLAPFAFDVLIAGIQAEDLLVQLHGLGVGDPGRLRSQGFEDRTGMFFQIGGSGQEPGQLDILESLLSFRG
jgi:hypothetical protein